VSSWKSYTADQLLSFDGPVEQLIEPRPAIYLWKRSFRPEVSDLTDSVAFMEWLRRVITAPVARMEHVRVAHFLTIQGIALSGELTDEKIQYLSKFTKKRENREMIVQFLRSLAVQAPALYVGETKNAAIRVVQHLDCQTTFGLQVNDSKELNWSDLEFHYLILNTNNPESAAAKDFRTSLELIAANVTIAGMTRRPG
jgi:hypothetical protein